MATRILHDSMRDLRYAIGSARRRRASSIAIAAVLGICIGTTTSIWSAVDRLLLSELPVAAPDQLFALREIWVGGATGGTEMGQPTYRYDHFLDVAEATKPVFSMVTGYAFSQLTMRGDDGVPLPITGMVCAPNYFETLGVRAALGNVFREKDDNLRSAVLSYQKWVDDFRKDPDVIGRSMVINGRDLTVVAVMPATFTGTVGGFVPDVWIPIDAPSQSKAQVTMIARLREGQTSDRAAVFLRGVASQLPAAHQWQGKQWVQQIALEPLKTVPTSIRGGVVSLMTLLLLVGITVIGVAVSNVAILLVARAAARERELAIHQALGATSGRIVRLLVCEGIILAAAGALVGLIVSSITMSWLATVRIPLPVTMVVPVGMTARTLALGAASAVIFGAVATFGAVRWYSRMDLARSLRSSSGRGGLTRFGTVDASLLIQVAGTLALLSTATLFSRSLLRALATDPGVAVEGVYSTTLDLTPQGYGADKGRAFFAALITRLQSHPEIVGAGLGRFTPLSGNNSVEQVPLPQASGSSEQIVELPFGIADSGYFGLMRLPIVAGRGFDRSDAPGSYSVIVNETLARAFWPNALPIGRQLTFGGVPRTVVGVVRNSKYAALDEPALSYVFLPTTQSYMPMMNVYVRPRSSTTDVDRIIREASREVDGSVAVPLAISMDQRINTQLLPQRIVALLVGALGILGLALATLGIYALVAERVELSRRELSIRIALGAPGGSVIWLSLRRVALLTAIGSAVGLTLGFGFAEIARRLLFDLSIDSASFAFALTLLLVAALIAAFLPAQRAARADPMNTLRDG